MRRMMALVSAGVLLLLGTAQAVPPSDLPKVANAHYGRDGFWHCDAGYSAGDSGTCEPIVNPERSSVYGRLRDFEISERTQYDVEGQTR